MPQTRHHFNVIRLWEVDYSELLDNPGVWPFAVLGKGGDNEAVLRDVANRIDNISDKTKAKLAANPPTAMAQGTPMMDMGGVADEMEEDGAVQEV